MDKQYILDEIKRTAQANGGKPFGKERFQRETGIRFSDWFGKHWARFGDALSEAGFAPNEMRTAYPNDVVIGKLVRFIREQGHFPVTGELRLKQQNDKSFPSHSVFGRLGSMAQLRLMVAEYCRERKGYEDVIALCSGLQTSGEEREAVTLRAPAAEQGFVYLAKSGRYYKIGMSNAPGRREYELSIQSPVKVEIVHTIPTGDPTGAEKFWHGRFKAKWKHKEWYELDPEDVRAFRRCKSM